ncbi:MAG: enoyl-CoA hydratase/isomerase family protein [Quisquiliibacterium sp.]
MNESPVLFEERATLSGHRIGVATLNRPGQLNALTLEMCQLLRDRFRAWASDEGIVAVLLEGAGDKGFCAGGDVAAVVRQVRSGSPHRFVYGDAFFEVEYSLDRLIHEYPKPFIAYSHGICMGGGVGLIAGASHRVVSDASRIAMPEIHIGLFPDVGGGYFLNRLPGGAGVLMALTGLTINEADAVFAGLADFFVPRQARERLYERVFSLDWSMDAAQDRGMLTRALWDEHGRHQNMLGNSALMQNFQAIRSIALQGSVVDLKSALLAAARQNPYFDAPAKSLENGSPTAAQVSWEYLRRCRRLSLGQVLALDLVLARQFQRHHDFPEGVRALLIDKDRKPAWSPTQFDEVDGAVVQGHFSPL